MFQHLSFSEFVKLFPTDAACLEEIKRHRFPKGIKCTLCRIITKHYRVKSRLAYACKNCRKQTYPLTGTMFTKSSTPLRIWFYALFLLMHTNGTIPAKQLQNELGVTYKTAWRMKKRIIKLLRQQQNKLFFSSQDDGKSGRIRRWVFFKHFEIAIVEEEQLEASS